MMILGHDLSFWVAVGGATLFKLLTSHNQSWKKGLLTVGSAVLAAWLATDAVLHWMNWSPDTYKAPTAAMIALVGENVMRWIVTINPERLIKLWKDIKS